MTNFTRRATEALGVLVAKITVGPKSMYSTFFIVDTKLAYLVLLGRDWIYSIQMCTFYVATIIDVLGKRPSKYHFGLWMSIFGWCKNGGSTRRRKTSRGGVTLSFEAQDPLEEVNLGTNDEPRMTKVSGLLAEKDKSYLVELITKYMDCFAIS